MKKEFVKTNECDFSLGEIRSNELNFVGDEVEKQKY